MNRDDILRMAQEAGLIHFYDSEGHCTGVTDAPLITADEDKNDDRLVEILEPFANLVAAAERERIIAANAPEIEKVNGYIKALEDAVAAEREACAKVCEAVEVPDVIYGAHPDYLEGKRMAISQAAAAIRERGAP